MNTTAVTKDVLILSRLYMYEVILDQLEMSNKIELMENLVVIKLLRFSKSLNRQY